MHSQSDSLRLFFFFFNSMTRLIILIFYLAVCLETSYVLYTVSMSKGLKEFAKLIPKLLFN